MYIIQSNSDTQVTVHPEYDFKRICKKIESEHRTKSGDLFKYKWGSYDQFKFSLRWVNSSDRFLLNSWWKTNVELQFYPESDTSDVFSCLITNKEVPIGGVEKPYTDQFKGTIELSQF